MIRMYIIIDGIEYLIKESNEAENASLEEISDIFYEQINGFSKLKLELDDGSIMIIGEKVIGKATFIFREI